MRLCQLMLVSDATVRIAAPAKINLYLRVGKRRDDGYHPLLTWMCTIGLFDMLQFVPARESRPEASIAFTCSDPAVPGDRRNLVIRAAEAMAAMPSEGRDGVQAVSVRLDKRIPVGAGLGGGSSDAVSTLLALNRLWNRDLSADRLHHLAEQLGSDVPFFLHGPSSVCRGRGELVQPIARPRPRWAVLVLQDINLSTAEVYDQFDRGPGTAARGPNNSSFDEPPWEEWTTLTATALLPTLVNDLEPAAFSLRPELGQLRERLEQHLSRPVRMSGSGSSLFTLYDERSEATNAASQVSQVSPAQALAVQTAPAVA
jgi:4-diphosphocytidyl-2-C-methyl-D-erythritol kinase